MGFSVSARAVLELGAELISSDAIAIYELIKNAIDAGSTDGIEIHFVVTLSHAAYIESLAEIDAGAVDVHEARARILGRCHSSASPDMLRELRRALSDCRSLKALAKALRDAYATTSWVEFRDTGRGMSQGDLLTRYLVIGTPSRKVEIDAAEAKFLRGEGGKDAPYLGEKGVGRLSAMRLGTRLRVETATRSDKTLNLLEVDWDAFNDLSLTLSEVKIEPTLGGAKPSREWSGTNIRISNLTGRWGRNRVAELAMYDLARIVDPFLKKRRFRVAVFFNDERLEIPRLEDALLKEAHASVQAKYQPGTDALLTIDMMVKDAKGKSHAKTLMLQREDIWSVVNDPDEAIPTTALATVGAFDLEAYWYNRRLLMAVESIGDRRTVRDLQRRWSGIMLFRNGYRVSPYGDDRDDWLGLDRKALASQGYKLNKSQFVGRVRISRFGNPQLKDQTNREGLQDCAEKFLMLELLRYVVQQLLRNFMNTVENQQRQAEGDFPELEDRIVSLERRAKEGVQRLSRKHKESSVEFKDVLELFKEMKGYFIQARDLAEQAEDERMRLIQLAGVGLMLEVVAHELARSTEHALAVLGETEASEVDELPEGLTATLRNLRREMKTMNKRLRVLDPLSVSARQRKETFDLVAVIRDSFAGHEAQFARHDIRAHISFARKEGKLMVVGIRGMFVQIVENLLSNSIFWLTARQEEEKTFEPAIAVIIDPARATVSFADNGPGIALSLRDEVFKPFFSTKDRKRRQGLGLYIARECAVYNDAEIDLLDERTEHKDRLNTFVLRVKASEHAE